jgi:hypothetical protein
MPPSPIHFVEGALASLDLARDTQPLLCRIIAFGRDDVVLAPHGRLDLLQHDALTRGEDAYLLLDAGSDLRALRCRPSAVTDAGDVVAQITDGIRLGQRRMFSRADLVVPTTVAPLDGSGAPWMTFTRNVGAGGVRLARQSGYVAAVRHGVEIQLPGEEWPVGAVAEIRHETADDFGMSFVTIEPDDRMRLEQAAITWQRRRLRLAA